jgi:hypothetical protein
VESDSDGGRKKTAVTENSTAVEDGTSYDSISTFPDVEIELDKIGLCDIIVKQHLLTSFLYFPQKSFEIQEAPSERYNSGIV